MRKLCLILPNQRVKSVMKCYPFVFQRNGPCTLQRSNYFRSYCSLKLHNPEYYTTVHQKTLSSLRILSIQTALKRDHLVFQKPQKPLFYNTPCCSYSTPASSILKNHSALLVKRPSRKKIPKIYDEGKVDNVVAYAVAEEIKLESLKIMLFKQGLYHIGELPKDVEKVLHIQGKYSMDKKPKDIFVFEDGSVVFWCVPEIERGSFLKMLGKHSEAPYQTSLVLYEREEMDFANVKSNTGLKGDVIQIKQADQESLERKLELYTISNALAQSVKLALWEASLDRFVTSIVSVTEDLRQGRKIGMSRRQVLMKTGELFALKHLINLSSDLLDTPDFYWERTTLEPLYQSISNYLRMSRRTRVVFEVIHFVDRYKTSTSSADENITSLIDSVNVRERADMVTNTKR